MTHILIIGAGAVGGLFGSAVAKHGAQVSVVCRSDFDIVQRQGYAIRSPTFGNHVFRPHRVYRHASGIEQAPDYAILSVKVLPDVDRVALLRPAVGPQTTILLIENGIDIERDIAEAFPHNELLSAVAFVAVGRTAPGEIEHLSLGSLTLGAYPSGITQRANEIGALLSAAGVPCKLTDDIVGARWQKAVWNTAFNPVSILGGVLDTAAMLRTPEDQAFIRKLMNEVCTVAAAAGHAVPPKLIDALIGATVAMPAYKTSMALDFENGRAMELEAILGNVVRAGDQVGVDTPALDTIYAVTRMIAATR